MSQEYKIKYEIPEDQDWGSFFQNMPGPIHRETMSEIYNYRIENDGVYFIDQLIEQKTSSEALGRFIEEALKPNDSIEIIKL